MATINNSTVYTTCKKICSFICPENRKEMMQNTDKNEKEMMQKIEKAREENREMMKMIMEDCQDGKVLFIKFDHGMLSPMDQEETMDELESYIYDNDVPWCYTHGTGLICIDPAKFGNDPEKIAKILWEPNRWLEGAIISRWWYREKRRN